MITINNLDGHLLIKIFLMIPRYLVYIKPVCKKFYGVIQNDSLCKFLISSENPCHDAISQNNVIFLKYLHEHNYDLHNDLILFSLGKSLDCFKYLSNITKTPIQRVHLMYVIFEKYLDFLKYMIENMGEQYQNNAFCEKCCYVAIQNDFVEGLQILYPYVCKYKGDLLDEAFYSAIMCNSVDCLKYLSQIKNSSYIKLLPKLLRMAELHKECHEFLLLQTIDIKNK